jgi:hypothetical protein
VTRWIGQWSLLSGPVPVVVLVLGVFAAAWLVLRRDPHHLTRTVPLLVLGAALAVGVLAFLVQRVWRPFPDPVPLAVYTWVGLGLMSGVRRTQGTGSAHIGRVGIVSAFPMLCGQTRR